MPTPRALSNEGREGSGLAQILPNAAPNPFEVYYRKQAMQGAQQKANLDAKVKQDTEDANFLEKLSTGNHKILASNVLQLNKAAEGVMNVAKNAKAQGKSLSGDPNTWGSMLQYKNLQAASQNQAEAIDNLDKMTDATHPYTDLNRYRNDASAEVQTTLLDKWTGLKTNASSPKYFTKNEYLGDMFEKFKGQYGTGTAGVQQTPFGTVEVSNEGTMRFGYRDANGNFTPGITDLHTRMIEQCFSKRITISW